MAILEKRKVELEAKAREFVVIHGHTQSYRDHFSLLKSLWDEKTEQGKQVKFDLRKKTDNNDVDELVFLREEAKKIALEMCEEKASEDQNLFLRLYKDILEEYGNNTGYDELAPCISNFLASESFYYLNTDLKIQKLLVLGHYKGLIYKPTEEEVNGEDYKKAYELRKTNKSSIDGFIKAMFTKDEDEDDDSKGAISSYIRESIDITSFPTKPEDGSTEKTNTYIIYAADLQCSGNEVKTGDSFLKDVSKFLFEIGVEDGVKDHKKVRHDSYSGAANYLVLSDDDCKKIVDYMKRSREFDTPYSEENLLSLFQEEFCKDKALKEEMTKQMSLESLKSEGYSAKSKESKAKDAMNYYFTSETIDSRGKKKDGPVVKIKIYNDPKVDSVIEVKEGGFFKKTLTGEDRDNVLEKLHKTMVKTALSKESLQQPRASIHLVRPGDVLRFSTDKDKDDYRFHQ